MFVLYIGQSRAGGITICGGPLQRDSMTLDVATKFIKSIVYAIPVQ